jgi:hypothetical protein
LFMLYCHSFFLDKMALSIYMLIILSFFVFFRGQSHPIGSSQPSFGPSQKLDFELEMVSFLHTSQCRTNPYEVVTGILDISLQINMFVNFHSY